MPENRTRPPQRSTARRKRKRYNPFKLSVILMFFVICITVSFIIYAMRFDITSKKAPSSSNDNDTVKENVVVTDDEGVSVTDAEGNTVTEINEIEAQPVQGSSSSGNPVPESERQPDSYLENSVFIGDSITTGLSGYKFVSPQNVLASVGLRVDNITTEKVSNPRFSEEVMVIDALNSIKPENVYILLGSNGVAWLKTDDMYQQYGELIDSIKSALPETDVYIISITPVGTMKEQIDTIANGKVLNSEIDAFNSRLINLADEKGVHYVDVNSELKDENGKLPDDVTSDGMHFNKDTYIKFVEYILTHTYRHS